MPEIGSIFIKIGATTEEFRKKMDEVAGRLEATKKRFESVGKSISGTGKNLSKWVTAPIVGVAAGLSALVLKTAAAGDEIQKMSLRTGFSAKALSEYKHVCELSGTSLGALENAVKRMQKGLLDAEQGSKTATDSLGVLGLTVKDLQGLSPEQQFDKIAAAIANIENPTIRAALAQEVFGRAGTELLPMLAAGGKGIKEMREEARRLGIVFDKEAADAAAKFIDDLGCLKKAVGGVFIAVGKDLLPVMTNQLIPVLRENLVPVVKRFSELLAKLIKWFVELNPRWQAIILAAVGLSAALGPVLVAIGSFISFVGTLIGLLPLLGAVFAALTSPIGLAVAAIATMIAIGVLLYKNWDTIKTKAIELWMHITDVWNVICSVTKTVWNAISSFLVNLWTRIRDTAQNMWSNIYGVIKSIIDRIRNLFEKLVSSAYNWGRNLLSRFIDGIRAMISRLWNTLTEIGKTVSGFLGFHSATKFGAGREADKWAPKFVEMYAKGLESNLPKLQTSIEKLSRTITTPFAPPAVVPAAAAVGGETTTTIYNNTFYITVSGGTTREQAEDLLRELAKRGVKF